MASFCKASTLTVFACNTNLSIDLLHAPIIDEVSAVVIIYAYGFIFVRMWVDNLLNLESNVFDSLRSESAWNTDNFANGFFLPSLRSYNSYD